MQIYNKQFSTISLKENAQKKKKRSIRQGQKKEEKDLSDKFM